VVRLLRTLASASPDLSITDGQPRNRKRDLCLEGNRKQLGSKITSSNPTCVAADNDFSMLEQPTAQTCTLAGDGVVPVPTTAVGAPRRFPCQAANQDTHPRERAAGEAHDPARNPFLDIMTQAPYRTKMAGLDIVLDRVRDDDGILGGLNAYLWRYDRGPASVLVNLQLKHRPRTDDHLEVRWNGGRLIEGSAAPDLEDLQWDTLASVDWTDSDKMLYTVNAWGDIVRALHDTPKAAAKPAPAPAQTKRRRA
jgi:hypothetical protein